MGKRISIALLTCLAIGLSGCGGNTSSASTADNNSSSEASSFSLEGKNVTFICPWSAGGSSDAMTRKVAEMFAQETGSNTSVENQEGAGGTTATTDFVNAPTDGTKICLEAVGVFTLQPLTRDVSYSIDDFTPVCGLTTEPIIMFAGKNSGIEKFEDLKSKDSVSYGFNGAGSLIELCQKRLFMLADINATGVSYDGSSEVIAAVLGGHIDVGVAHPADCLQYIESGDFIPLGIFNSERDTRDSLKDIPTFKEQGYDVDFSVWKFMIVPSGTPDEIVNYETEVLNKIVTSDEFQEFCTTYTLLPNQMSADEIKERIAEEYQVNKELLENS